ncbi:reverse transcriptase domain-containing protein [Tanacetum coccineum]
MSSSTHPITIPSDYEVEDAFSSINVLNYFLATPGNTSLDFSDDLTKYHLASLAISPFHNNPYMKVIQAYDVIPPPQAIIALPAVLPLSPVLSLPLMFDSRDFFPPEEISPPKDIETPIESPIPVSPSSSVGSSSPVRSTTSPPDYLFDVSIFAELDNSLYRGHWEMPLKGTSTSETPTMTQDAIRQLIADSITAALEAQAATMENTNRNIISSKLIKEAKRSPKYKSEAKKARETKSLKPILGMPPKRTSTSETPTMTQDAIRQLIADSITAALEAQAATMENTNRNIIIRKMEDELYNLTVKRSDLKTYIRRFQELATLCPTMVSNTEKLLEAFIGGLPRSIEGNVFDSKPQTLEEAINIA